MLLTMNAQPCFEFGKVVATPAFLRAAQREIDETGRTDEAAEGLLIQLLTKHGLMDGGCLDTEDQQANLQALKDGSRIFSAFMLPRTQVKIWIITEALNDEEQRASTCLLLPEDY